MLNCILQLSYYIQLKVIDLISQQKNLIDFYYNNHLEKEYEKNTDLNWRKKHGQFFTPFEIATFMSEWILGNSNNNMKILDPCCGLGIFERTLKLKNNNSKKLHFTLYDIEKEIFKHFSDKITDDFIDYDFFNEDFLLSSDWDSKYDGIIANPPYYKHHFINKKQNIVEIMRQKTGFDFSIQTNIYCWFLIKSLFQLKSNGRLAFIIPSEFLNSNYGEKIKKYFLSEQNLKLNFINIDFKNNVFDNALTTSIIILAEKTPSNTDYINFYHINDFTKLNNLKEFISKQIPRKYYKNDLISTIKWRNYFISNYSKNTDTKLISLSEIGRFSRGIATGANEYFTLSKSDIKKLDLKSNNLIPCITKACYAKNNVFTNKNFNNLYNEDKKVFLFDGVIFQDKASKNYVEYGESLKFNERYLTKNRHPWYSVEKRSISKIWMTVFQRNGLRFIWNETNCVNLTCFHAFYPKKNYEHFLEIFYIYLNTNFAKKIIEQEKREYGNGLEKFEPNDINNAKIFDLNSLSKDQYNYLKKLQNIFLYSTDDKEKTAIINSANSFFLNITN